MTSLTGSVPERPSATDNSRFNDPEGCTALRIDSFHPHTVTKFHEARLRLAQIDDLNSPTFSKS
jgi:hypothetical protein